VELVITSNWGNFWHGFASRGFVSVSCVFLYITSNSTFKSGTAIAVSVEYVPPPLPRVQMS